MDSEEENQANSRNIWDQLPSEISKFDPYR